MVNPQDRSERIAAEAAAWLARLESTGRTEATEAGLQSWLGAHDAHRHAFEQAMDAWAIIPGAAGMMAKGNMVVARPLRGDDRSGRGRLVALAASLLLVFLLSGWWLMGQSTTYSTSTGEQKIATLEDGSRIALNTDTHLAVDYDDKGRSIRLDSGEAMFEVAHNPRRPFIVTAGDKTVTALGTSFIVRKVGDAVVVTLIAGKVRVDRHGPAPAVRPDAPTFLSPGERLTAAANSPAMVTRTSSEAATAWRRGQVMFNDTPLSAAIAELNRYGGPHIDIADPHLGGLMVSGVFAANDTAEFASAVAALHGLRIERGDGALRLVR